MKFENPQDKQDHHEAQSHEANNGRSEPQTDNHVEASIVQAEPQPQQEPVSGDYFEYGEDGEVILFNPHPGLVYEDRVHAYAVQRAESIDHALNEMFDNPLTPIGHLQTVALQAYLYKTQVPERKFQ